MNAHDENIGRSFHANEPENNRGGSRRPRHLLLHNPEEWLEQHTTDWVTSFRVRLNTILIGCADARVGHACNLRYPGLGVFQEEADRTAQRIADLQHDEFRNCQIILQTHDDCLAARQFLRSKGYDDNHVDLFAEWRGRRVARIANEYLEYGTDRIQHKHLHLANMNAHPGPVEAVYIDCTNRFTWNPTLPYGPVVSILKQHTHNFSQWLRWRFSQHLLPSVELMTNAMLGMKESSTSYAACRPLSLIVVRDSTNPSLSHYAQRMVEAQVAEPLHADIQVLAIDEKACLHKRKAA